MNFTKIASWIVFSAIITSLMIFFASSAYAELKIDSVEPTLGLLGRDLEVTLTGSGFDLITRVSMYPDSGNKRSIVGSLATPGFARGVKVVGTTAYVVDRLGGLQVVDISTPSSPLIIGSVNTPGQEAASVTVVGTTAYVVEDAFYDDGGLQVIDVSTPSNPRIIGSVNTPGDALDVMVAGNSAFIADGDSGLQVIDVSNPKSPRIIGSVDTPGEACGVAVVGTVAYVADGNSGLQVIDVSNPKSPQITGSVDTPGFAPGVTVADNMAYVADGDSGLQVIDVGNPANPEIIGTVDTPGSALGVAVVGTTAYVADGTNGLHIIDVSTPASPHITGTVDTPGSARGVAVAGTMAYVADMMSDLQVIEVSSPANSQIIGSVDIPGTAVDVTVFGTAAYVADADSGLHVIDVSTLSSPKIIGSVDLPGEDVSGVTVVGTAAYLVDEHTGLHVVDVSTPSKPRLVGSVDTPGSASGVAVIGTTAYVGDGYHGLQVIDVSVPSIPQIIGTVDTLGGSANDVTVVGTTAYVTTWYSFHVIDVSDPKMPQVIGSVDTLKSVLGVTVVGTFAYIAGGTSGFQVIDVSDPKIPQVIGSVDTLKSARDVTVVGNFAYVAAETGGFQVIDVSTPSSPLIIGVVDTPEYAHGVKVIGNTAYVADGNGFVIVPVPTEIDPVTVNNSTSISVTLPSPIMAGNYTLRVFNATESDELLGAVSFTDNLQTFNSKAIIVAGGGPNAPGEIWEETKQSANKAYDILVHEGYDRDSIWYLSMENGNDRVNGPSLRSALNDAAINSWAADASELVIFFVDHGLPDNFIVYATGGYSEQMRVDELDDWLDTLQQTMIGPITFIYDACHSGTFASKLVPPDGKNRIIITGASDEAAYFHGEDSFSFQFWEQILLQEGNLGYAFSAAADIMQGYQSALINADGDSLTNEAEDFSLAKGHTIRRGKPIYLKPAPTIGNVMADKTLNGSTSATIWVSDVHDVESVWARIIPPDINPESDGVPITALHSIQLQDADHDGIYEGTYNGFTSEGTYTVVTNAQTSQEIYSYVQEAMVTQIIPSSPVYTSVTQMNGIQSISADSYEADDTYHQANVITLNGLDVQPHNFHDPADVDWVKFYGLSGQTYTISAGNVSVICDVVIELFDSDGATRLSGRRNNSGTGKDELLGWTCTRDDVYYVKLSNAHATFGENCKYDFKLYRSIGPFSGYIKGTIKDALSGQELADVRIDTDEGASGLSLPNGGYVIVHAPGTYNLTAQKAGYDLQTIVDVPVSEGDLTPLDILLTPQSSDSDGDGVDDSIDNCPNLANTDQSNNDDDNAGDVCDPDDDDDGMPDEWEEKYNLNPFVDDADDDPDKDGVTNYEEYVNGTDPGVNDNAGDEVEAFVTRFYQLCLDREPDQVGLDNWVIALIEGDLTGSDVAYGFVFSQEFINKNTTNEEYLQVLYEAFFKRQPDPAGWQGWLDVMQNGAGREEILKGFIYAKEFNELCREYGILPNPVAGFVTRFYNLCLKRDPDVSGLDGWVASLLSKENVGADVAEGFIFSPEFTKAVITDEQYMTILYKAFFNRDPDPAGLQGWLDVLNSGKDRAEVLDGFIYSTEFGQLCEKYGITPFR